jgi:PEP-CTERM motif-containing protein
MKRILLAAALLSVTGIAHAGLSFSELSTETRTEAFDVANLPGFAVGTTLKIGSLDTDQLGTVKFTFLGQESGYTNSMHLTINGQDLFESDAVGKTITASVSSLGPLNFKFTELASPTLASATNGGPWDPNTSIGLIGTNMTVTTGPGAGSYAFVIGYNDSAGTATLGDWDDFVVGVNFTPAIPEPEIYAMLIAGFGLMGFAARRRKSSHGFAAV